MVSLCCVLIHFKTGGSVCGGALPSCMYFVGFPGGSVVKNPPANARDMGWIPESGRSPGEGNGNPLQYSCMGPADRRSLWATGDSSLVAQMVKCLPTMWETQVRSLGREDPLEKEKATHSSIPAWDPWTGGACGPQVTLPWWLRR